MSSKEFALFLQLIARLIEKGDTEEVLKLIKKAAGEISDEPTTKSN